MELIRLRRLGRQADLDRRNMKDVRAFLDRSLKIEAVDHLTIAHARFFAARPQSS
jgi:hypothetical protein